MNKKINKITISAILFALGLVLPFFTGQIREIGKMLLPMHLPVMLCGLVCGEWYGLIVGILLPILRSSIFGMPILYPSAVAMSFELGTYGLLLGILYYRRKEKNIFLLYRSLIITMLAGRIIWGIVSLILYGVIKKPFTFSIFFITTFTNAIPGIILQLVLIPVILRVKNVKKVI